jgi:uncharacterized protein (TIGR03437 family)
LKQVGTPNAATIALYRGTPGIFVVCSPAPKSVLYWFKLSEMRLWAKTFVFASLCAPLCASAPLWEVNRGQFSGSILFVTSGGPVSSAVTRSGIVFSGHRQRISVQMDGAVLNRCNPSSALQSEVHYLGFSPPISHVPLYSSFACMNAYPGIDWLVRGKGQSVEHDWKLAPGADARAIVLSVEGTASAHLESNGDLELRSGELSVFWKAPNSYQLLGSSRLPVESRYVVLGRRITLQLGAYRHDLPLIIDPLIDLSYVVNGNEDDRGCQVAVDSAGNIYLAGLTLSPDFQTTPGAAFGLPVPSTPANVMYQVFVRKLSPDGSKLIYSTYLGTTGLDSNHPLGLRVDSSGNVYLAANEFNNPGIITTPIDPHGTVGIYKLSPDGSQLLYATRVLPGFEYNQPVVLDIDSNGNAYVGVGSTTIAVSKIDPTGTKQLFLYSAQVSNYFGGLSGIAAGVDGTVYLAGSTAMGGLVTTPGALKTTVMNSQDFHGYLIRLKADGSAPIYSTYIGGDFLDDVYALSIDASGAAYVAGTTSSQPPFPGLQGTSLGASQPASTAGVLISTSAFVMKVNPQGTAAVFTSLLPNIEVDAMAIDSSGNVYAAGLDNDGVAMAKVSTSGSQLLYYSSIPCQIAYLQAAGFTFSLAVDSSGDALLTSSIGNIQIPETVPGYITSPNGFLLKMDAQPDQTDLVLDPPTASFVPEGIATVHFVIHNNGAAAEDVVFKASELGQGPIAECRASGGGVCGTGSSRVTFASIPAGESETIDFELGSCQNPLIPPNGVNQMTANATVHTVTSDVHQDNSTTGSASADFVPVTVTANTPSIGQVNLELFNIVSGVTQANAPCELPNTPPYALPNAQVQVYWPTPQYSSLTGGAVAFVKWQDGSTENPRTFTATPPQLFDAAIFTPLNIPYFTASSVVNAGSYAAGGISPGEFITLSGLNFSSGSPQYGQVQNGRFTTSLAGVSLTFDGTAAPLVYSSYGQINAIVPYEVAGKSSTTITFQMGSATASATVPVVQAVPSLFTADASGIGQAAALNQDGSVNSAANPANPGNVIVLYGTGEGLENPVPGDGAITAGAPPSPQLPISVTIGGAPAKLTYAGAAPGLAAGVIQINAVIPTGIAGRNAPVNWTAGTYSSQSGVTIAINESPAPGFTYQPSADNLGLAPISITTPRIAVDSGPTIVTIFGFGFVPGMVAEWNNQPRLTQYVDETRLQVLLTASDLESPELGSITVWNSSQTAQFSESAPLLVYLPLANNDLVYDSTRGKIYVSVAASQMPQGSSIAILDPEAGRIDSFYPLGTEPTLLTLSGDNKYLYVAIGNKIRRIDLNTWTPDLDIPLGSDPNFGARQVVSMMTLPGANNSVAVAMSAPEFNGLLVAIFDDAQMRPTTTPGPPYLIGGPAATTIYATADNGDLATLAVSAQGVTVANTVRGLLMGGGNSVYAGGLIYNGYGAAVDPAVPSVVATYDNQGLIVPLTDLNQVLILSGISSNNGAPVMVPALTLSNSSGGARLWSLPMPLRDFIDDGPLLRWGANGFALREYQPVNQPASTIDLFRLNLSTPGQ